jgi:hypothetical protein
MADLFTGVAAPDVNTTKTTATTAPDYFKNYLTDLANAGTNAMAVPGKDLVAGMTPLQTAGYAAIPAAATAYQPGLTAAEQTAQQAAGVNEADINQFMNPYTTNVVNRMGQLSDQNLQRTVMPQLKGSFVGTGGLGSQRFANATGQSLADISANLTGQQYGALSAGYSDAVKNAIANAQLQNQAATTQGNLAAQEQTLGLAGAGAETKAGAEQQAYEQAKIEAPLKQATNAAALMKGYTVPTSTTETYKGPMAGVYANSPLSQIAGLGTLVASGTNAKGTGWLDRAISSIGSSFPGSGPEQVGGPTGGDSTPTPTMYPHINPDDGSTYYTETPEG